MTNLESRTYQVESFGTHVVTGGANDATPILLLHDGAWGADAVISWGSVAPLLVEDFRLIMPDMLGFGLSAKVNFFDRSPYSFRISHLAALLQMMEIDQPIHIVGSSFGGSIALRAAIAGEFPIASATSMAGTGGPWRREEGKLLLGNLESGRDYISRIVHAMANTTDGLEAQIDTRLESSLRTGHYAALSSLRLSHPDAPPAPPDDFPASLSQVNCPVTIVNMSDDRLNEHGWVSHIRAAAPNVRILEEPGPHCLNLTDPIRTAALIRTLMPTPMTG